MQHKEGDEKIVIITILFLLLIVISVILYFRKTKTVEAKDLVKAGEGKG